MTLNEYLDRKSLSIRRFAETSGVSAATVCRIVNGGVFVPRRETRKAIVDATKGVVTNADLLGLADI